MPNDLCRFHDAFVSQEGDTTWTIGNSGIRLTVGFDLQHGFGLRELVDGASGHTWRGSDSAEQFRVEWNGATLTGRDARTAEAHAFVEDGAVRLVVALDLGNELRATVHYRLMPGTAAIQQWLEIEAHAAGTLYQATPLALGIDHHGSALLRWVRGVQQQGGWRPDAGPYNSFRIAQVVLGQHPLQSGMRSTWDEIPWLVVSRDDHGSGIFAGLQYSGRWQAATSADGATLQIRLGPSGIAPELAAGAHWTSSRAFVGVYTGDLDDAAAAQHRFYRTVLSPKLPPSFPWVQYNTWFSYFCDYDEVLLRREAELAADLGVELFYIDAGWWTANPRHGSNFSSGLGNWQESREKFPGGLRAFADFVRAQGMRFGIWIEPERVDVRTASTGMWRPDWLALHDGTYVRPPWPVDTETAWLCFGNAETRAWAVDWIGRLVEELGLAWIKWDSNWWGVCTAEHHEHGAGDGEFHQVAGVHAVMDALRRRYPDLVIENCAGGGTRMDFGMAEHTHVAWVSDASEPSHRVRFHLAGATYPFPPEILNTWVAESTLEDLNGRRLPRPVLDAIFRSRMLGAFGISCRTGEWPTETRNAMRDAIRDYKVLRPVLAAGRVYHLLPQPDLTCPSLATPNAWEAYQILDPAVGRGAMLVFRGLATEGSCTIVLKGLDSSTTYRVACDGGQPYTATGGALMTDGITCELLPLTSTLVHFEAIA